MRRRIGILLLALFWAAIAAGAQDSPVQRVFRIKYVADGVVYVDGGRNAGLAEQQLLKVSSPGIDAGSSRGEQLAAEEVASIRVLSLADASAVCEILSSTRELEPGDVVLIPPSAGAPAEAAPKEQPPYLQLLSFNTADPLEDEMRADVPKPRLPEINRARGRIGVEYNTLLGHSPVPTQNSSVGLVLRANMTRIGGTYWNFNGYWRGRLSRRDNSQAQTVSDLLNRTYQLGFTYTNPFSSHVAGFGRVYVPWASSLDILDGGYAGLRSAKGSVAGVFGSTPDPTSWDYSPNRKLTGAFYAIERGSFDDVHFLSTTGLAISAIHWTAERQFAFTENTFSYHRLITAFESMQVDAPHDYTAVNPSAPTTPVTTHYGGINRSYVTVRFQPHQRLTFDLNHTYFRGVPTFDPVLIGTGLLDRYLFQGLSGGVRAEAIKKVTLYANLGRSRRSGDAASSWNRLYGITFADFMRTEFRVDARYAQFTSTFGQGSYEAISVSRQMKETIRLELVGGLQKLSSTLAADSTSHFLTSSADWAPGRHLFMQTFYTWQRGGLANYDQFSVVMGSRF